MDDSFIHNNISEDANPIRDRVRDAYSAAADNPANKHRFPVGRLFAESIGYSKDILEDIPELAIESFAGVSNVPVFAEIPEGATVLDIGCGAGLDCLIAARKTGPKGKVIGVDFSDSMLKRAQLAAEEAGYNNIEFKHADAENIPVDDASIDIVLANGIFNLNPEREKIFSEISRVLHHRGSVYSAELILNEKSQDEKKACDLKDWLSWIAGAKEGGAFLNEFRTAGFNEAVILRTSRNARTKNKNIVAADVFAHKAAEKFTNIIPT